ncbi:hypothetical protein [Segatella salivae]|uniref:Uncharacterized protein n=1 Tax=Segatella salivae DSM 15606 TaxID=888832 RepID=E6MTS5_9BACT|nr:hypothetical protein [Segatella salivae]EFV02962.1 hypothetical protein HMPREF9420_2893 [Segatella salivae DSM 15606]
MFGMFMTIIIIGYVGYYGYNIIHDLYFDKTGEIVSTASIDEKEVDIKEELGNFTLYEADEDQSKKEDTKVSSNITIEETNTPQNNSLDTTDSNDSLPVMSGGIKVEELQEMLTSLENDEVGSDYYIVARTLQKGER